jgi:hypothetical protein
MPEQRSPHRDAIGQGAGSDGVLDCKRIVYVGTIGILGHPRKASKSSGGVAASGVPTVSAALVSHDVSTHWQGARFSLAATLLARRISKTPV